MGTGKSAPRNEDSPAMLLVLLIAWAGAIAVFAWALATASGRADAQWERAARARPPAADRAARDKLTA